MSKLFRQYCNNESGATAIEYGFFGMILLVVLISIVGTGGVDGIYQKLKAITSALNESEPAGQTQAQGQLQTQTGLVNQNHLESRPNR